MESGKEGEHARLGDPIIDRLRTLAGRDETLGTKLGEMLREGRLAKADPIHELSDGKLPRLAQVAKHQKSAFVRNRLQHRNRFSSLARKSGEYGG